MEVAQDVAGPEKAQSRTLRYVRYVCSNPSCGAEDQGKFYPEESIPPVINCWRCGAGRGMGVDDMIASRRGMFAQAPGSTATAPPRAS